jgi:hypothetical protein
LTKAIKGASTGGSKGVEEELEEAPADVRKDEARGGEWFGGVFGTRRS